jgi:four helix bundle protein
MRKYYFEKLDVWQKGRILIKVIYSLSNSFPSDEKFGITSQIRRAVISVNCNIVSNKLNALREAQLKHSKS